jgi:alkylation response protein AidB-like acyl-CoA dehydrogenase
MDFRLSPHEEALRKEACDWLTKELGTTHDSDPVPMPPGYMPDREFERKLGAKGWLSLYWPKEYGGQGRPIREQFLVEKEVALHGGPASDAIARVIVAPLLMEAGSEAQKQKYLLPLARGEVTFCLGYSEPGSGSDLASLQTRAVRDGDDYVINGRKIWTSGAESSEYCWLAVRTESNNVRHAGITMMVVPMDAPGVEVRPIVNLLDKHWFNETVFEDVRVPVTERVGGEGEGWRLLGSALGVERITIYRAYVHWRTLVGTVRWAKQQTNDINSNVGQGPRPDSKATLWDDAGVRRRLGQLRAEYEIAELLLQRAIWLHEQGHSDYRAQAAMVKLFNTEFAQRLYETSVELMGLYGTLMEDSPHVPYAGATAHNFLSAVQDTIGAGTSEVQREVIALRGLGLPRG